MKKIIVLLALLTPLGVLAEDIVRLEAEGEPVWQTFAPPSYSDVDEPRGIGKLNETATYWYKRKVDFEKNVEACKLQEDEELKNKCYQQIKLKQYQLNSDYNARMEAQEQAQMVPMEMYDKTNSMMPLGGCLDAFTRFQPNEFR